MRNLLAFMAAMLLTFTGLGYYFGWYHIRSVPAPEGHRNVSIDFNTVKIGEDLRESARSAAKWLDKAGTKTEKTEKTEVKTSTTDETSTPFEKIGLEF